jgi:hypothetical protein
MRSGEQIAEQIAKQGGTTRLTIGPFGPRLLAEIPATTPDSPALPGWPALHRRRRPALVSCAA